MSTHYWQKSSYSGQAANCVELAGSPSPALHLRESDDPENIISTTPARLDALLRAVKACRLA